MCGSKFSSDGVQPEAEASELLAEMESMMNMLLVETGLADPDFSFSEETRGALGKLTRIDWSNTRYALEGNGDEEKYIAIYKFVRVQRDALEESIERDLSRFKDMWLERDHVVVGNMSDATVCGTVFDEDKYLCALDLQLKEVFVDDPQPGLAFNLLEEVPAEPEFIPEPPVEEAAKQVKVRKRDRWLQEELVASTTGWTNWTTPKRCSPSVIGLMRSRIVWTTSRMIWMRSKPRARPMTIRSSD